MSNNRLPAWSLILSVGVTILTCLLILQLFVGLGAAQSCTQSADFNRSTDWTNDGTIDRVEIIDCNGNSKADMEGDTWLFDAGADGSTELIIKFQSEMSIETQFGTYRGTTALLYDDVDGDGDVDYRIQNGDVVVTESDSWSVAVVRREGSSWVTPSGVNYRYTLLTDREPLERQNRLDFGPETISQVNGSVNRVIESYDSDGNNLPNAQLSRSRYPNVVSRATAQIYHGSTPPITSDEYLYFPLLSKQEPEVEHFYDFRGPPISVDWEQARISDVRNLLSVDREDTERYNARNQDFQYNKSNKLYFEIPFNRYDLAADSDGYGELVVNNNYEGVERMVPLQGPPIMNTRYSWDQTNDNRQDYRINYLSFYQYRQSVELQPLSIKSVPYDDYPEFITGKQHQGMVFVDANDASGGGRSGSEGLYNGQNVAELRQSLSEGGAESEPDHFVPPVIGWRSEYATGESLSGQLYHSPIDGELHLKNADKGRWIIDGTPSDEADLNFDYSAEAQRDGVHPDLEIRYSDQDDDGYMDTWSKYSNSELQSRLVYTSQYLVFYDAQAEELGVKQIEEPVSTWEGQAPSTHAEWAELRNVVSNESTPSDLGAIYARYSGEAMAAENVDVNRIDPAREGVHISATLSADSRIAGTTAEQLPDSNDVIFVFNRESQNPSIQAATTSSISIANHSVSGGAVTPLETNRIEITVQNNGWQTAENVTVAIADRTGLVANKTVSVTGKQVTTVHLQWWPQLDSAETTTVVQLDGETVETRPIMGTPEHRAPPSLLTRYTIANRSVPLTLGLGGAVGLGLFIASRRLLR